MKILVVEDEPKIAKALKKGLEQESFAVDVVCNGKQGISYALSGDYDLLVVDRMLPDITDGIEICHRVRERGIHVPILLLTAKDKISDRVQGLVMGADDYLIKPFAFEEFVARVRALLRRPSQALPAILTLHGLSLDTNDSKVERDGKVVRLTLKEFALLEYLMRNEGRTLAKQQLISHIWDDAADVLPNTVEVYIGYLRNKVDKPFHKKLIHTVRGFGYKFGTEA